MKSIHELLEISEARYEEMVLEIFLKWAQGYTAKANDWQNIIANAAIAKWFRKELSELEKDFVSDVTKLASQKVMTAISYKQVYHFNTLRIYALFPKPLIEEAKAKPLQATKQIKTGLVLTDPLQLN